MYSIKILCEKSNISQQTFYRLVRENKEFRDLVENGREKKGNGYKYNPAVLEWLIAYYDNGERAEPPAEALESPVEPLESSSKENALKSELESLRAELEDLQAKYNKLTDDYSRLEAEKQTLLTYQGNLLFLLTQEKAEKQQLLLSAPHKTIADRIKGLFKREKPIKATVEEEPKP